MKIIIWGINFQGTVLRITKCFENGEINLFICQSLLGQFLQQSAKQQMTKVDTDQVSGQHSK